MCHQHPLPPKKFSLKKPGNTFFSTHWAIYRTGVNYRPLNQRLCFWLGIPCMKNVLQRWMGKVTISGDLSYQISQALSMINFCIAFSEKRQRSRKRKRHILWRSRKHHVGSAGEQTIKDEKKEGISREGTCI